MSPRQCFIWDLLAADTAQHLGPDLERELANKRFDTFAQPSKSLPLSVNSNGLVKAPRALEETRSLTVSQLNGRLVKSQKAVVCPTCAKLLCLRLPGPFAQQALVCDIDTDLNNSLRWLVLG